MGWAAAAAKAVQAKQAYDAWNKARKEKKKEKAAEKAKEKEAREEKKKEKAAEKAKEKSKGPVEKTQKDAGAEEPEEGETSSDAEAEKAEEKGTSSTKSRRSKRFSGWVKGKAPAAGAAVKGAALGGVAVSAGLAGAGIAAGAGIYRGGRSLLGGGWRVSKSLFVAINILFIASILFHWRDIEDPAFGNTRLRGLVFILFAVYAWLFIYSKYEVGLGDLKALIPPLLISAVALVLPVLLLNSLVLSLTHMQEIFTALLVFVPVWPIVIMFGMPSTRMVRVIRIIYILIIVIAFVPSAWYAVSSDFYIEPMRVGATKYIYDAGRGFVQGLKLSYPAVKSIVVGIPGKISKTAQRQIQYAVGDYYTGQVEEGKNRPIGVYIENVEPVAQEFYADDTVVVWATLIARTLDPDKEITVTASCYGEKMVGDELKKEKGDADPMSEKSDFEMKTTTEEEKYITCEFPPRFFDPGAKSIFVKGEFNFETMSYIRAYFMNLETMRTMKRDNMDPLDYYKVPDKMPQSASTFGPVAVNIKTSEVPIGVSSTETVDMKLGITLENAWQGMIGKMNDVTIKIPESLEITYCDHAFEKVACAGDECEEGKYTSVYKIKKAGGGRIGLDSIKDVAGYHSITCRLRVKDINRLMGNYPIVADYFKVTADYTYELEKSTFVTIKEALKNGAGSSSTLPQQKPTLFRFMPTSSSITVNVNTPKEFSVAITNPGSISYAWKSEGVFEGESPDTTSYIFTSDKTGQAKVIFMAVDEKSNVIEEKQWDITVVE